MSTYGLPKIGPIFGDESTAFGGKADGCIGFGNGSNAMGMG